MHNEYAFLQTRFQTVTGAKELEKSLAKILQINLTRNL